MSNSSSFDATKYTNAPIGTNIYDVNSSDYDSDYDSE